MEPTFTLTSEIWQWNGKASWHFITIPEDLSKEIKNFDDMPRRGFGSVPVKVTIGETTWKTSIFPEKKGTYVLPLKAIVRKKEKLTEGQKVKISFSLQ